MLEKILEKKLREKVKMLGGLALKFYSPWFTGLPDRVVLMPGGKMWWVEMKKPGSKTEPHQDARIEMLRKMEFDVRVIDSNETLTAFIRLLMIEKTKKMIDESK